MFIDDNPDADLEDILAHYGVLGMHWGIRHDPKPSGRRPGKGKAKKPSAESARQASTYQLTAEEKALLKKAGVSVDHSAQLKAKYGPGSNKPDSGHFNLTPHQKHVLIGVGAGVGVAAALAGAYYFHNKGAGGDAELAALKNFIPKSKDPVKLYPKFKKEWELYQNTAGGRMMGLTPDEVAKLGTKGVDLPAGHIIKRISTEMEKDIRPNGFFAAHQDSDVERYKAILPIFWKQWDQTAGKKEGFVVHLAANVPIKAPSHKETFDLFKGILHDEIDTPQDPLMAMLGEKASKVKVRDLFFVPESFSDEQAAAQVFPQFSQLWANGTDQHPMVQHFFKKVKEAGYNALPDINDAGALAANPLRVLDGSIFKIVKNEPLTEEAIKLAQENIQAIVHMLMQLGHEYLVHLGFIDGEKNLLHDDKPPLDEDTLLHYGVLGMHWGVRKGDHPGVSRKTNQAARKDAVEFARAKMFYGDGAGTRRKLIKAKVEQQSKVNSDYKKAFDHHLSQQDMGQHADKARSERKRKNAKASVGKNVRAANRVINGPFASGAAIAIAVSAYGGLKASGLDQKVAKAGRDFINKQKFGTKIDLSFLNN